MSEMSEETTERNRRKVREGIVVSTKMDKTVVVSVVDRGAVIGGPVSSEAIRKRAEEVARQALGCDLETPAFWEEAIQSLEAPLPRAADAPVGFHH